jgi:Mg2+-importing ATPase
MSPTPSGRPRIFSTSSFCFPQYVTILFPFTPLAELLGFQPLPMTILLVIGMIVVLYIIAAEMTKWSFYKRVNF